MAHEIRIEDRVFRVRRETYRVLLDKAKAQDDHDALVDEANGLAVEIQHAEGELLALGEQDGPFQADRRAELIARLRALRSEATDLGNRLFLTRLESIAARLDPTPEVDYLLDHLDPADLERVTAEVNRRPPDQAAPAATDETTSGTSAG